MSRIESKEIDGKKVYDICIAIISVVVSFCLIFAHEIWRDEGQAWVIARDTPLLQLVSVLRHEGHPVIWYLILMPFAKCGLPCIWMNYISWAFTAVSVFVIALKAPWHPVFKTVVLFSPMFVYWMPVVSRSYSVLNCLIILMACFYSSRKEHPIRYGILLFLAINTHVIIAGFVGAALLIGLYDEWLEWKREKKICRRRLAGILIGIFGCLLMVLQLAFSPGTGDWNVSIIPDMDFIKNSLVQVMVIMFSTTNACVVNIAVPLIIGVSLVIAIILCARKEWHLLLYYVFGIGFIWYILIFVLYSGNKMYMLYSVILFVLWNMKSVKDKKNPVIMVGGVLVLSMITGYPNAILYDIRELYSSGEITAEYLNQIASENDRVIFLDNSFAGAVTPHLNREIKVWDITECGYWYYTVWSPERTQNNEILKQYYQAFIQPEQDGERLPYTETYMTDFFQGYMDQFFEQGTVVYLVLNEENAGYFDCERKDERCTVMASFNGDCRYTGEKYTVYRMVAHEVN